LTRTSSSALTPTIVEQLARYIAPNDGADRDKEPYLNHAPDDSTQAPGLSAHPGRWAGQDRKCTRFKMLCGDLCRQGYDP